MSAKKPAKGLGRGFSSLIPADLLDESFDPTAIEDEKISELRQIKLTEIITDPAQPRQHFDQTALNDLANSIREHGVVQPIILTPKNGKYIIVAGERRFRASKLAGQDKIPAIIRTLNAQHHLELSLIENLQRHDLNPMETATAYLKLRDQFNMSLDDIAKRMGIGAVSTVSNKMRLLKLPKAVQQALVEAKLTEGQARPLIGADPEVIKSVLPKIISENWSARKIEQFIVELKNQGVEPTPKASKATPTDSFEQQIKKLSTKLQAKVAINSNSKGAGKITISFKDQDELKRLEELLSK